MALSLPGILFLCDWFFQRKFDRRAWVEKLPRILYTAVILLKTIETRSLSAQTDGMASVLIWVWSFSFYLWKFLWPAVLVPLYQLPSPVSIFNPPYLFSWIVLFLIVLLVFRFRQYRRWVFLVLFYLASVLSVF
jgi:hypothetical protein